jgi:hypothetical protein
VEWLADTHLHNTYLREHHIVCQHSDLWQNYTSATSSAKNISVRVEWLRQRGRAPSEPSETPRWQITLRPAPIPRIALHITRRSQFRCFFSLCRYPIVNQHCGVVANCDHASEWKQWFLGFHNHKAFRLSYSSLLQSQDSLSHNIACNI